MPRYLDDYTEENTKTAATDTGPYEAEVPRNDYQSAPSRCTSNRCMGWCLLDPDGRNCDQIGAAPGFGGGGGNPS